MPIYEYKCPKCSTVFEEWVKSHDTGPQNCPDCGTEATHIVSNTTFVLKGGGWYVTEYGNRKNTDSVAASNSTSSTDATADSTPAASPAPAATSTPAASPAPAAPASSVAASA